MDEAGPPKMMLTYLEQTKFLTKRIFPRISENMHFEIFKNVSGIDLIEMRGLG